MSAQGNRTSRRWTRNHFNSAALGCALACAVPRAAVSLQVRRVSAPADARVYIDEQFVDLLGTIAARGVRLPEGHHRLSITREGYFPWDQELTAGRQPIRLDVTLRPLPD